MIYTITTNPALDYYMIVDKPLIEDEVNRSSLERYVAAGKGLNVSKVLQLYGISSKAVTVIGGFTGKYIADSFRNNEFIDFVGIETDGNTRINSKIFSKDKCFCVNGNGPEVSKEVKNRILESLNDVCQGDFVLLCGKNAKGLDETFVEEVADIVKDRNGKLVIDMETINKNLIQRCKPFLIKPNLYELNLMMGRKDITIAELENVCRQVIDWGVSSMLVSLGKDGAYYCDDKISYKVTQPEFKAVNKVGCGDAMLASFIGMLETGKDVKDALAYATAAGCATAASFEEITLSDIHTFIRDVKSVRIG